MTIDPVSIAISAGLTAASMALTASQKIEGPRLDDLTVTVADYGTALNYFRGLRRFEGVPIFFAEPLKEVKRRRKTKGGKFNDYTYFGTFAVAIADHEIDGVTRIWFDKHLIYDATGAGPVTPFTIADGFNISDAIRIYLGTETQEPDPRMLATVDAAQGAGSTPAYRGVSYIFFEDIPLEKLGNRVPQISVEAVTAASPNYPWQTEDCTVRAANLYGFTFSPDFSYMAWGNGGHYEVWDVAARSQMISTTLSNDTYGSQTVFGLSKAGELYALGQRFGGGFLDTDVFAYAADGTGGTTAVELAQRGAFCQIVADTTGDEYCCVASYSSLTWAQWFKLPAIGTPSALDVGFIVTQYCADDAGNIWAVGGPYAPGGTSDVVNFFCISGLRAGAAASIAFTGTATLPSIGAVHNGNGAFVVAHGSGSGAHLLLIDDQTLTVTSSASVSLTPYNSPKAFINCPVGAASIWLDNSEYSLADLSLIRTINVLDWTATAVGTEKIHDPVNNAIITFDSFADEVTWLYLDRVSSDGVTLQSIVEFVADKAGIDPAYYDATNLDQIITGYSWTQGSGKDILDPLLDAYDSIVRPHDFTLQFKKRGDSSGGTILTSKFVRQSDTRYKLSVTQDTDLPRRVTFSFADVNGDQQTNSVVSQRPLDAANTVREQSLSMTTLACDAEEARGLSDRWFRRRWFERIGVDNALTMQLIALEPGDVRTLDLDGNAATYRLAKASIGADGVIACNWVRDDPSLAVLPGQDGAEMDGRAPAVITVAPISKGFVLDIPLLTDAQNSVNPLLYYGAGPYVSGSFPGATFYEQVDGAYETEWANVLSTAGLTWGYSTDVLPDGLVSVWDRGHSVNVIVKNGTLTSTTEATCDATTTANLALLGDELIQFTTATLEMDGSYTLSGFKRGRRGTEWATAGHSIGEKFVLLDMVGTVQMGLSDVGTDLSFKAVTQGRDVASAFPIPVAPFTGASLKPYAPALVTASKDAGTGDWTIDWVRRSRIGGAWTSGTSVPLGEDSEEYEVDILDSMGAVVRTYSGLTSPTVTYDETDQLADGADVAIGDLSVAVYQISASVDRGFAAPASF